MADIQFIVDRLNEPPFQLQLSLVAFDEKSPFELLEIVNTILATLSDSHKVDLRDETPESTATRMIDFLRVLNYKQNIEQPDFKQGLLHGDPGVLYPMLTWMLHKRPELQKRAYLGRFLVDVEVPQHMFTDEELAETYQNYKDLQEEFKEVHKASEKFKKELIPPNEIKKAIKQMEEDKDRLEQKVEALHSKLQSTERFDEMQAACSKLRTEQDEQLKLQDRFKEQRAHLMQAEQRLAHLRQTLQEKRATEAGEADMGRLLGKLDGDVKGAWHRVHEELPALIMERQQRMEELQQILSQPEVDPRELAQRRHMLMQMVGALEDRKRSQHAGGDDKLAMFRQQANLVGKKKEQVHQRLDLIARERREVDSQLASKATELDSVKSKPVLKGEDFRKYATELRGKTAQYKRMKAELAELRAEWGLLSRTEGILRKQEAAVGARLSEAEARRGVSGFQQTQEQLEVVSQQKAEVDETKGKTLEEISSVVEEINSKIKSQKAQLAPQIKELRTLRAKCQEDESEYLEKKAVYDNTKAGHDSDVSKLNAELDSAEKEGNHEESTCSYYESLASIDRVKLQRTHDERAGKFQRTMPDGQVVRSVKELYDAKIRQQEQLAVELRDRQRSIKDHHEPNKVQMTLFRDLHKLLRCKVDMQQRARAEANEMAAGERADTNVFTMPEDGPPAEVMPVGGPMGFDDDY